MNEDRILGWFWCVMSAVWFIVDRMDGIKNDTTPYVMGCLSAIHWGTAKDSTGHKGQKMTLKCRLCNTQIVADADPIEFAKQLKAHNQRRFHYIQLLKIMSDGGDVGKFVDSLLFESTDPDWRKRQQELFEFVLSSKALQA